MIVIREVKPSVLTSSPTSQKPRSRSRRDREPSENEGRKVPVTSCAFPQAMPIRRGPSKIIQRAGDLPAHGFGQFGAERRRLSRETACRRQPGGRPEREAHTPSMIGVWDDLFLMV